MMRIIAGRFRHRTLLANPGNVTRPILDRVKESLFARMENLLQGARVADVFSGTGTLGFEALSRGAKSCVFVESDRKAQELLRKNVEKLKVEDCTLCWATDATRSSFRPQGVEDFIPFDVIFFDPPYKLAEQMKPGTTLFRSLERLARADVSSARAWLVVRTPEHCEYTQPEVWQKQWQVTMSNMTVDVFRKDESPVVDTAEVVQDVVAGDESTAE